MEVELPESGCNILTSDDTFYNYSVNRKRRRTYVIYEGKAFMSAEANNEAGYTYTGTCLSTGDLVYKPEYKEFIFPNVAIVIFFIICILVYKLLRGNR